MQAQKVQSIVPPDLFERAHTRAAAALEPLTGDARARVAAAERRFELRVLTGAYPTTSPTTVTGLTS